MQQGCPLSVKIFTLILADLDEKLKKRGKIGEKMSGKMLFVLAYGDDI